MDETDVKINFAARAVLRKWPSVTTNELAPPQAAQRWPERIVLDTSQPTIVPAPQQTAWNDIPPKPLDARRRKCKCSHRNKLSHPSSRSGGLHEEFSGPG
jgi:hypothetical protein